MGLKSIILVAILALSCIHHIANAQTTVFDITSTKYGAKAGADISSALLSAWKDANALSTPSKIVIPKGTWLLTQVRLEKNNGSIELQVQGTVQAPTGDLPIKDDEWIMINYVNNFELSGGGVFDGRGLDTWKQNNCDKTISCKKFPYNLSFNFINNSYIHDITTKDSKNFHVDCISSTNVRFERFTVTAPANSPNTDGLHLARDFNITVVDSNIATGDDCISIGDDSREIHIENVKCGPGHGISIGSLGKMPEEKDVVGIYIKNCSFTNTQNGIRVKTWPSSPSTMKVSELHFEDLIVDNVTFPIVIDQEYCPHNLCQMDSASKIQISKIRINNVKGTAGYPLVASLVCSGSHPCQDVEIGDIDITYNGNLGPVATKCENIRPTFVGKQNPPLCAASQQSIDYMSVNDN